jgi:hypothetical protein
MSREQERQSLKDVSKVVEQTFKNMKSNKKRLTFEQAFKIWNNAPRGFGLNSMCMENGVVVLFKDLIKGKKLKVTEKGVFVERGKSTDLWGKGWIKVVEKAIK